MCSYYSRGLTIHFNLFLSLYCSPDKEKKRKKKKKQSNHKPEADRDCNWVLCNSIFWRRIFTLSLWESQREQTTIKCLQVAPLFSLAPCSWLTRAGPKISQKSFLRIYARSPGPSQWQKAPELLFTMTDNLLTSTTEFMFCNIFFLIFFSLRAFFLFVNTWYIFDLLASRQSNMACQQFTNGRETGRVERGYIH